MIEGFVDRIINGDCIDVLRNFPDNSVDAVVTDPPYGLGEIKNLPGLLLSWLNGEDGSEWQTKGFMGKGWDKVPPPSIWKEVLRVLKPGAYILCFAGCRTVDLMGISLRLAGFEDNNLLAWIQGQGFPKATDVGKMIDKAAGAEREVIGRHPAPAKSIYSQGQKEMPQDVPITAPATPEAKKWDGWKYGKQALKPAMEPILLMQKPFEKGLAGYQNVLKWGTGALNIEACRIPLQNGDVKCGGFGNGKVGYGGGDARGVEWVQRTDGRFPANVLLDEEAARALDEQSGYTKGSGKVVIGGTPRKTDGFVCTGSPDRSNAIMSWGDSGGASRFFYVAKASTRERNAGLNERNLHPTVKPIKLLRYLVRLITPPDGIVLDPFCGTGTTCIAAMLEGFHYIGIEKEEQYYKWAKERIAGHKKDSLF